MLVSGVALNFARGIGLFVGPFALSADGASLILVEAAGALYFVPMLLGNGIRRVPGLTRGRSAGSAAVRGCGVAAIIVAVVAALLAIQDLTAILLVMLFMFVLGSGNLINVSLRLPLLQAMIGRRSSQRYMAVEAVSSAFGALCGPLAGAAVIAIGGVAASLVLTAAVLAVAAVSLLAADRRGEAVERVAPRQSLRDDLRLLPGNPSLQRVLAVTVLMNMGFFAAVPIVPFLAHERGMDAIASGWLASMIGLGGLVGAILFTVVPSLPAQRVYVASSVLAPSAFAVFALADAGPGSFLLLGAAGIAQAGFTVEQPVLTFMSVAPSERLTAMGLLSLGVGTVPLGVLLTHGAQMVMAPAVAVAVTCALAAAGVPLVQRQRTREREAAR